MTVTQHQSDVAKQGAEDSGRYFKYMAEFVGFTPQDAETIKKSKPIIEKHLPDIVAKFYAHLLRYTPTRKFFLKKDGSIDHDYLELRMRHLTNFWLRTSDGVFDDAYARYVDYVGRAHTSHGADPNIYIAERYVIGQVGMIQHAISEALSRELKEKDPTFEIEAVEAWDELMMVILEMLARAYGDERDQSGLETASPVDEKMVAELSEEAFEREEGTAARVPMKSVAVADMAAIADGERKIVHVDGLSIGIFHHKGGWYAYRNSCLHRGGPVVTGKIVGDVITCPWHGFQYDLTTGKCLADPSARLDSYQISVQDGQVYLQIPDVIAAMTKTAAIASAPSLVMPTTAAPSTTALMPNEFRISDVKAGQMRGVQVDGADVAVYNVGGAFYATQNDCTHAGGSLDEGDLSGNCVTCPIHGSQFDVTTGKVIGGPADEPLRIYKVTVELGIGRVTAS